MVWACKLKQMARSQHIIQDLAIIIQFFSFFLQIPPGNSKDRNLKNPLLNFQNGNILAPELSFYDF